MKTLNSKMLAGLMLIALVIGSNGCMTQSTIEYAKGHPENAWINNDFGGAGTPANPKAKPHIVYYLLVPVAAPADVVTSPFQLLGFGFECLMGWALAHSSC